jgi:acetyltransferase-like isoleucine patch superfamily enzyme
MVFKIGKNSHIDPAAQIKVKDGYIGENSKIEAYVRINADYLEIGDRSILRPYSHIEGRHIKLGHEAYLDELALIGGGSAFDPESFIECGDFLHMGKRCELNPARGITAGHELGAGVETKIFTHGTYQSAWDGFPIQWEGVKIGDRVWLPNAWVNPGVKIGDNIVVAAGSLVNNDLPSGCLAGGVPAKILKENVYPRRLTEEQEDQLFKYILSQAERITVDRGLGIYKMEKEGRGSYKVNDVLFHIENFDIEKNKINGPANDMSEILKNQLRRNGIRFRYKVENNKYVPW